MSPRRLYLLLTTFMAIAIFAPAVILAATERVVVPTISQCPSGSTCYTTIQAAINAADAAALDFITVHPGTYRETVTLNKNVPLEGTETARVFISGNGSAPIITVSGVTNTDPTIGIRRLTFINATTGISVINSSAIINITNNIFRIGTAGTAVSVDNSATVNVINNTFYQNFVAISFTFGASMDIENNIFYGNGAGTSTAISNGASATTLQYNCFFNITADQTGTVGNVTTDPLFVSASTGDFHLRTLSPCINAGISSPVRLNIIDVDKIDGTRADMGAYGGPNSDTIPFQISGLSVTGTTPTSISLNWTPNNCYLITTDNISTLGNPRGYRVYYGSTSAGLYNGTDAGGGTLPSPIKVNIRTDTAPPYTLSSLTPPVPTPTAPTLNPLLFANQTLIISWSAVAGGQGYKVYYGTTSPPTTPIDVGNVTSYTLSGLTNGTLYYVAVSTYAQATYYLAVTAYDNANLPLTPGVSHESAYSQETSTRIGPVVESGLSSILQEYPETITPSPNLPNNGGCFIATAAYGHYSAPQVRALREFRDRYLLTNAPGRTFVRWYYEYGPIVADCMNKHPWLKPVARVALMPAVGVALVTTGSSSFIRTVLLALLALFILCVTLWFARAKMAHNQLRNHE